MKNFSILMLALAFCLITHEANAQDKKMPKPRILDDKTWTWEGSKDNYAKYSDLVFEVGMGNERNGVGCGDAGVEIENVRKVRLSVDASPVLARLDANAFAGFMVDYSTAEGYTKRVALSIGVHSDKRTTKTPIWGKVTTPDQYVDLGRKKEYDLDLKEWAPDGWNGKVWFTVTMQNTGRNTSLKATLLLPSEADTLLAAKVIGRFDMSCAEIPKLDSHWLFTKEGRAIQDGNDMGAWSVVGGKAIIMFTDKQFGLAVLSFKNEDTLVGKNEHRNGSVFNWVLKREKIEVAQKPKDEPGKKREKVVIEGDGTFNELARLPVRPDTPWTIAISPDASLLASGGVGKDQRIYVSELLTGKTLHTLEGHTEAVRVVVFSPDSKSLFSGSLDGTVREWDMGTGRETRTIVKAVPLNKSRDVSSIYALALSPDGKTMAVGCTYTPEKGKFFLPQIRILTVRGQELMTFPTKTETLWSLSFSPNGKLLASAGHKVAKVWEIATGKELAELKGHKMVVQSVAFSPDGTFLATAGTDKTVKMWKVPSWEELPGPMEQFLTDSTINSPAPVVFSPDGRFLAVGGIGDQVQVWDTDTRKRIMTIKLPSVVGAGAIVSLAFSSDSSVLAMSSSWDKRIHLWGLERSGSVSASLGHLRKSQLALATKVAGQFIMFCTELPQQESHWIFTKEGRVIQDGNDMGTWGVGGGKAIITFTDKQFGKAVLLFKNDDTLVGKNEHRNGSVFNWVLSRYTPVDFSKVDYTKGPNGEKIIERQGFDKEINKALTEQGFIGPQGQFVRHGKLTNWYQEPMAETKGKRFSDDYWFNGKPHGKLIMWYESGKIMRETLYEHGKQNGQMRSWYENGSRMVELAYFNNKKNGLGTAWYENGKKLSEGIWRFGRQHGEWTWWHDNGEKMREASFNYGHWNGTFVEWNSKSEKTVELTWASGRIVLQDPPSPDDVTTLIQAMAKCEMLDVKVSAAVVLVENGFEEKASIPVLEKGAETRDDARWALKGALDVKMVRKLVADKKARPLDIRIGTKKKTKLLDFMVDGFNSNIVNARGYASESDVVLQFNIKKNWRLPVEADLLHPLVISVYDKNGFLLTRFTTKEEFTPSLDTYRLWNGIPLHEPRFLWRGTNTLRYGLSVRTLKEAAIVEVGFCDARE